MTTRPLLRVLAASLALGLGVALAQEGERGREPGSEGRGAPEARGEDEGPSGRRGRSSDPREGREPRPDERERPGPPPPPRPGAPAAGETDLVLQDLRLRQPRPRVGESVEAIATIRNAGREDLRRVSVRFFLDDRPQPDRFVHVAPGGTATARLSFRITAEGPRSMHAIVDPDNRIPERNERNNLREGPIALAGAPGPGDERAPTGEEIDLVVTALTLHPAPARPGDDVEVRATVANRGPEPLQRVAVRFHVEERRIGRDQRIALPPGGSATVRATVRAEEPGHQGIFVAVDPDHEIPERDEENNHREAILETLVLEEAEERFDLAVVELTLHPAPARSGEDVELRATVANHGPEPLEKVAVRFHVEERRIGRDQRIAVPAGGSALARVTVRAEEPGLQAVFVAVDPDHEIPERDEENNHRDGILETLAPEEGEEGFDLAVVEVYLEPPTAHPGETVRVRGAVANASDEDLARVPVWFGLEEEWISRDQLVALRAGEVKQLEASFRAGEPGDRAVYVVVDPQLRLPDPNRRNNVQEVVSRVRSEEEPRAPTGPDLRVAELSLSSYEPRVGEEVRATATLRNDSDARRELRVRFSVDEWRIGRDRSVELGPGESRTVTASFPAGPSGAHVVGVQLDPDDAVAERDEGNNRASRRIAVVQPLAEPLDTQLIHGGIPLPQGGKPTTPWPKLDGSHGPVTKPVAGPSVLSWDASTIKGTQQIEYEVTFGSTFTKLDGDQAGRIAHGTAKGASGKISLDFGAYKKGEGTYYVRVAAQDATGKDLAYRSQPVLLHVTKMVVVIPTPSGGDAKLKGGAGDKASEDAKKKLLGSANLTQAWFTKSKGVDLPDKVCRLSVADLEPRYLSWRSWNQLADKFRMEVVAGDFTGGKPSLLASAVDTGKGSPAQRSGSFDLQQVLTKIQSQTNYDGKRYAFRVQPITAAGAPIGGPPSSTVYLEFGEYIYSALYSGQYLGEGTPEGQTAPVSQYKLTIMPNWNCWGSKSNPDHTKFYILFNQPMDRASVEKAFSISPIWPDTQVQWYDNDKQFAIGHKSALWFDTVYTFRLGTGAKTKAGEKILKTARVWKLRSYPYAQGLPVVTDVKLTPSPLPIPGDLLVSFKTKEAEYLDFSLCTIVGSPVGASPKIPGGTFPFKVSGTWPEPNCGTQAKPLKKAAARFLVANALGWVVHYEMIQTQIIPKATADLAIAKAEYRGAWSGSGVKLIEKEQFEVQIKNHGPQAVTREALEFAQLYMFFQLGAYGIKKVSCTSSLGKVSSDLAKGGTLKVVPSCKALPGGKLPEGTELHEAYVELRLHGYHADGKTPLVTDSNPKNNEYTYKPSTPLFAGTLPKADEVIVYDKPNYAGQATRWTLWGDQRSVEKSGLKGGIASVRIGSKLSVWFWDSPDLGGSYKSYSTSTKSFGGGKTYGSLILVKKGSGAPYGVELRGGGKQRFFPLDLDQASGWTQQSYSTLGDMNDSVSEVFAFRPLSTIRLYEAANQKGLYVHFSGQGLFAMSGQKWYKGPYTPDHDQKPSSLWLSK